MSGLRIFVDGAEGLRVEAAGIYADWTLDGVQWVDITGYAHAESAFDPSLANSVEIRAVATVTNSEGVSKTLETPFVSVTGTLQNLWVDVDTESGFAFGFGPVEGMALSVQYRLDPGSIDAQVLFTDGRSVNYDLDDADPSLVRGTVERDIFETLDWWERTRDFDSEGRLTVENTFFDNETASRSEYLYEASQLVQETHMNRLGLRDEKFYENGLITSRTRIDYFESDAYNFSTDLTSFSGGIISSRNMVLDNGASIFWEYSDGDYGYLTDGILLYRVKYDADHFGSEYGENLFAYEYITTSYQEDGAIGRIDTEFDDGRFKTVSYDQGLISYSEETDYENAHSWATKFKFYRSDGDSDVFAKHRNTTFDDGHHRYQLYELDANGDAVLRRAEWTDIEDAFEWSQHERDYDTEGRLSQTMVTHDDSVVVQTQYDEGQRSTRSISDDEDARAFTSIYRVYEESGDLRSSNTVMDDGRVIERRYDYGEPTIVTSVDVADAFVWVDRFDTYYAGELATRTTQFDDGVIQSEQFDQGQRTYRERIDESDARDWHSITEQFEDGIRISRDVVFDDDLIG